MWTVVEQLHRRGAGLLYAGRIATPAGLAYALLTIVALDYLHDAWFYWTHRLLHWAPVYRRVHYLHHQSTVPTAFAGYSFHVAEAALVFANEVLVCFLFPIHVGLHRAYHMFTTVIHNGAQPLRDAFDPGDGREPAACGLLGLGKQYPDRCWHIVPRTWSVLQLGLCSKSKAVRACAQEGTPGTSLLHSSRAWKRSAGWRWGAAARPRRSTPCSTTTCTIATPRCTFRST